MYRELATQSPQRVEQMIGALREFIGANQMMAYLIMIAARLVNRQSSPVAQAMHKAAHGHG